MLSTVEIQLFDGSFCVLQIFYSKNNWFDSIWFVICNCAFTYKMQHIPKLSFDQTQPSAVWCHCEQHVNINVSDY